MQTPMDHWKAIAWMLAGQLARTQLAYQMGLELQRRPPRAHLTLAAHPRISLTPSR